MCKGWQVLLLVMALAGLIFVLWFEGLEGPNEMAPADAASAGDRRAMLEGHPEEKIEMPTYDESASTTQPAVTEANPDAYFLLEGWVEDEHGTPVNADIVLLPKQIAGVDSLTGLTKTMTHGSECRWELNRHVVRGHWIAAFARDHDHRPGYLDGDAWTPEANPVTIVVPEGHMLEIRVETSDGRPPRRFSPVVERRAPAETFRYPGPEAHTREVVGRMETGPTTVRQIRLLSKGRMTATPVSESHYADPAVIPFDAEDGSITVTMFPACFVGVRVHDAATGKPVRRVSRFEIWDESETRVAQLSGSAPDGRFSSHRGIRPGRYRVRIEAAGYLPWVRDISVVSGDAPEISVALDPDETVGNLRITVIEHASTKERRERSRFVLMRRRNADGATWTSPFPSAPDNSTWEIEGLLAGEYDLLAWEGWSETVAVISPVRILPGVWSNATMTFTPGLKVPSRAFFSRELARFELRGGGIEDLPPVEFPVHASGGKRRFAPSMAHPSSSEWPKTTLGPYPFEQIEILETNKAGVVRKLRWPR